MALPTAMRALVQHSFDGPRDARLVADAPVPAVGAGHILIRVAAAGLNVADLSQSHGRFGGGPTPPYVGGIEAVGEVVALGEGVAGVELGAHVVGVGSGAFAEYMALPARAALPLPPGWSDAQGLGLMVNWPTAIAALKPLGDLRAGQVVLIHAAAGATGQATVRVAKHYGATVIASASPAKHAIVRGLGADHVLDSGSPDLAAEVLRLTGGLGADLVIESAGGKTFEASLASARRITGRVVVTGLPGGEASLSNWDLVYRHQVHVIGFNMGVLIGAAPQVFGEVMGELFRLIAAGVLVPQNPTVYDLADGPKALMALEDRSSVGKLALRP